MINLKTAIAPDVVSACQAGAEEAAQALGRALDREFTLEVGPVGTFAGRFDGIDDPGLVILLRFGDQAMAMLLPESSDLLPDWYAEPDATGESKLNTLAQELGMLLVPESLVADSFEAMHADNLRETLAKGKAAEDAAIVPILLHSGDSSGNLSLIWPLADPEVLQAKEEESAAPPEPSGPSAAHTADLSGGQQICEFAQLPCYARSLLKVKVTLSVQLAKKKESVQEVVGLATGSILQFDKNCESPLHLKVGEQYLAEGEAVKVGDKFGFRIDSMTMPDEHFLQVNRPQAG